MNRSLISSLRRHAVDIVSAASVPGGPCEQGTFTMASARRLLEEAMGFERGALGGEWKGLVKKVVHEALDAPAVNHYVAEHESSSQASSSSPPKKKPRTSVKTVRSSANKNSKEGDKVSSADIPSKRAASSDEETNAKTVELPNAGDDSDMSSVYDVPPSRSRKSKSGRSSKRASKSASVLSSDEDGPKKAKSTKRKKKDPNEGLSPDEAKVADLKRIVVACGVRKQWGKEFADSPTTSSQISHLKRLLADLGMKGAPTLGKAKSLKQKRELAQELDEVREFEAARGLSSDGRERKTRASTASKSRVADPDEDASESGSDREPDKEQSALGAVMDFLGGDSDSD